MASTSEDKPQPEDVRESEPVQPQPEGVRDVPRDERGTVIDESEPGDASRRAVEDWDEVPGKEQAVDFPEAGHREAGTSETVRDVLSQPGPRPEILDPPELIAPRFGRVSSNYTPVPALEVQITITTPDGRSITFGEAQEYPGFPELEPFDDGFDRQIADMLNVVVESATDRFTRKRD